MEPKALANLNGMMVSSGSGNSSSPVKNGGGAATRETQTAPSTPMNRRDSTIWMRTPPEQLGHFSGGGIYDEHEGEDEDDEDREWGDVPMLTPVPKTPAPEAIAKFADELTVALGTPLPGDGGDSDYDEELLTRTCPAKTGRYAQLGEGVLGEQKDQGVLARLVAARRKSLQYAPKISSPLAKTWSG